MGGRENYATWQEAFVDTKAHAKSNTKQIEEIKQNLREINRKLDENGETTNAIKTVVVDNGLCAAIKLQSSELKLFREEFTDYKINRLRTCPVVANRDSNRGWTTTVLKVVFAGIGVLSTVVVVLQYLKITVG